MRSLRVRPEAPGTSVTKNHIATWRKMVESFLETENQSSSAQATPSKQKWLRLQSYDLVVAIDWQLQCSTGNGLAMFAPSFPLNALGRRPRLSISCDAGPDNMCAASFLLNCKFLRLSVFFDPPHTLWRCMWAGCHDRISVVFLGTIICNLDRGPWTSESNWKKIKESMEEYVAHSDITCPLFRSMAPKILADRGMDPNETSPETLQVVFDSLLDGAWLRQKAPRVATTRWGTWHQHWGWLLPQFHEKLLACMACGLAEGWLTKEQQAKYAEALQVVDAKDLSDTLKEKTSVKEGSGTVKCTARPSASSTRCVTRPCGAVQRLESTTSRLSKGRTFSSRRSRSASARSTTRRTSPPLASPWLPTASHLSRMSGGP